MQGQYIQVTRLVERLHRRFLDVIKIELDRIGVQDINNVQALFLFNISDGQLTVGELTIGGYYLGSNVSYNVKKLVENGYLLQERSMHDRRMTRVRLSQKGFDVTSKISDLYQRHSNEIASYLGSPDELEEVAKVLLSLERYWSQLVGYSR
jgi:DNA-binding MarR family transcriptional regulator